MEPRISSNVSFLALEALLLDKLQFHFFFAIFWMEDSRIFGLHLSFLLKLFDNQVEDMTILSRAW